MRELLHLLNAPCRDITALVSQSMDASLSHSQRWAIRIHLAYCRGCRAYRRHLRLLRQILRATAAQESADQAGVDAAAAPTLSPETRVRMKHLLGER